MLRSAALMDTISEETSELYQRHLKRVYYLWVVLLSWFEVSIALIVLGISSICAAISLLLAFKYILDPSGYLVMHGLARLFEFATVMSCFGAVYKETPRKKRSKSIPNSDENKTKFISTDDHLI
jgi:hypothetical protein